MLKISPLTSAGSLLHTEQQRTVVLKINIYMANFFPPTQRLNALITVLCPQWSLSSNWGTPGPAGSGHIPSSQGGIPSSWGRGARTPPPSQATEREAALLHSDPSQNHNITTTITWDRKPSGNPTSISISFAQTERTDSQRNKSTLSFYLFSVHCGREIKISLSLQMGGFSWAMLQSREHFRLCGEQRPACLLTWLRRNVPL